MKRLWLAGTVLTMVAGIMFCNGKNNSAGPTAQQRDVIFTEDFENADSEFLIIPITGSTWQTTIRSRKPVIGIFPTVISPERRRLDR